MCQTRHCDTLDIIRDDKISPVQGCTCLGSMKECQATSWAGAKSESRVLTRSMDNIQDIATDTLYHMNLANLLLESG